MALIGDVIIQARETIPDMPAAMGAPQLVSIVPIMVPGGNFVPGNYFIVMTASNQWGQSLPSNELPVTIGGANNAIQITYIGPPGHNGTFSVYIGFGAAGSQDRYVSFGGQFTNTIIVSQIDVTSATAGGPPPSRSTAWLPDTDGSFISASAMYRWLNAGLVEISRITGGLLDYAGVPSVINQPLYQLPGQWNDITSVWYDGYWMLGSGNSNFYKRTSITSSILSSAALSVLNNIMTLEVYPQPARSGATTTLASGMLATDTTLTLADASGFLLPFGFAQIDSEIMAYATINGNQLTGLQRGLGGTAAVSHSGGAPAAELNLVITGHRQLTPNYQPGSSASTLPIPAGWEILLYNYVAGRAKIIEHDFQAMSEFNKEMRTQIKEWAYTNKGIVRRRQLGGPSQPQSYFNDGAGGLIVP